MTITLYTLVSATAWSLLLIPLVCLCCRSKRFVKHMGANSLLLLLGACALRLALCISFPHTIEKSTAIMNSIDDFFWYGMVFSHHRTRFMVVLTVIWAIGSVSFLLYFIYRYRQNVRRYKRRTVSEFPEIQEAARQIIPAERLDKIRFCVVNGCDDWKRPPRIVGCFSPAVHISKSDCTPEALRLILPHVYEHIRHHDVLILAALELLAVLFWWNPMVYLLKREIADMLECRCDEKILAGKDEQYRKAYFEVWEKYKYDESPVAPAMIEERSTGKLLERRNHAVSEKKPKPLLSKMVGVFLMAVLLLSYSVQLIPTYQPGDFVFYEQVEDITYIEPFGRYYQLHHEGICYPIVEKQKQYLVEQKKLPVIEVR